MLFLTKEENGNPVMQKIRIHNTLNNLMKNYSNDKSGFFLEHNTHIGSVMLYGFLKENPYVEEHFHEANIAPFINDFVAYLQRFDSYNDVEKLVSDLSNETKNALENLELTNNAGLKSVKLTFQNLSDHLKTNPDFENELKKLVG